MSISSEFIKLENSDNAAGKISGEKDKRFLIRQQLFYLFHAFRCTRLAYTTGQGDCQNQHCIMMRKVVKHIPQCSDGKDCTFPHCPSSKEIIRHWKSCNDVECQVCAPLRRNSNNNNNNGTSNNYFTNCKKTDEINCHSNSRQNADDGWKGKIRKIREKLVLSLTDDILPVNVCDDVRNHPGYNEVEEYVKKFESNGFEQCETMHDYLVYVSEQFDHVYQQLLPRRCARETNNQTGFISSLVDSQKLRFDKFYQLIKDSIERFYISIGGNPHELFDNSVINANNNHLMLKDEKTVKLENNLFNNNTNSITSDKNNILPMKNELTSTGSAIVKLEQKLQSPTSNQSQQFKSSASAASIIESGVTTIDVKMSPDSTTSKDHTALSNYVKQWSKSEIFDMFSAIHQDLLNDKDSEPFRYPVDWKLLDIPDYPSIIKRPIDLSTIYEKLQSGQYSTPWDAVDDYWLMFNNAWLYNKKTSKVYKMCNTLAKIFESKIDDVMKAVGFCCGREFVYLPQVLICCTLNVCLIVRDAVYYSFQNDNNNGECIFDALTSDKYICCEKCFTDNQDEIPFLNAETNTTCNVKKSMLTKCRNNVKDNEEFINCRFCNRKWHRVCANHVDEICREGFTCLLCQQQFKSQLAPRNNPYKAKHLPHNILSQYLEDRVNNFLHEQDPNVNPVVIRVLSSADKTVEVKPGMKQHYCETCEMPESFNYRLKAIFAFQEIDGQEVCFFGLHVQEYGSDCPDPNSRRVYIAYLDSVHFFSPRRYRTDVYHEFLVGYLQYVKNLGFTMAHIWACPPGEGDDYIFHMHPPEQKLPKPKRLQEWYIKMLDKAHKESIVVDYKDIFSDALQSKMLSPTELPYFEGDYWPNALEDIFKEINEENNKRQKTYSESCNSHQMSDNDGSHKDGVISKNQLSKMDKKPKKRKLKRMNSLNNKRKRSNCSDSVNDVSKRVLELMEKRKENFFVIRLHTQAEAAQLPEIKDPDPLVNSDLMDGRDKFLCLARERHLEFSSLRRARFSSLVFCYELHMEQRHSVLYSCNSCNRNIELRWTCRQCDDFELCDLCYIKEQHPHQLYRVEQSDELILPSANTPTPNNTNVYTPTSSSSSGINNTSINNNGILNSSALSLPNPNASNMVLNSQLKTAVSNDMNNNSNNANSNTNNSIFSQAANSSTAELQDTTRARMVRYSQSLQHACLCRDVNCRINFCAKMKTMIKHLQCCTLQKNICKMCYSFLRICIVHAKYCNDVKCQVPNCLTYRYSWKQQSSQQRMQQAQLLRRRVALMQRGTSITNGASTTTATAATPTSQTNSSDVTSIITPTNNCNTTNNNDTSIQSSCNNPTDSIYTDSLSSNTLNNTTSASNTINNNRMMINSGKIADPIHEEMLKQQHQQQSNMMYNQQQQQQQQQSYPMMPPTSSYIMSQHQQHHMMNPSVGSHSHHPHTHPQHHHQHIQQQQQQHYIQSQQQMLQDPLMYHNVPNSITPTSGYPSMPSQPPQYISQSAYSMMPPTSSNSSVAGSMLPTIQQQHVHHMPSNPQQYPQPGVMIAPHHHMHPHLTAGNIPAHSAMLSNNNNVNNPNSNAVPPPPGAFINHNFSEEDIMKVKQKYMQFKSANPNNPDEFKRQLLDFLSTSPRYRAAFDYMLIRNNQIPPNARRMIPQQGPAPPPQHMMMAAQQQSNPNNSTIILQQQQSSQELQQQMYTSQMQPPPPSYCYPNQQQQQPASAYFPVPRTQQQMMLPPQQHNKMIPPQQQHYRYMPNNPPVNNNIPNSSLLAPSPVSSSANSSSCVQYNYNSNNNHNITSTNSSDYINQPNNNNMLASISSPATASVIPCTTTCTTTIAPSPSVGPPIATISSTNVTSVLCVSGPSSVSSVSSSSAHAAAASVTASLSSQMPNVVTSNINSHYNSPSNNNNNITPPTPTSQ